MSDLERSIDGIAKTISEVLERKKFSIDYYQREYKWESKQLAELVTDLTGKFLDLHHPEHSRRDVAKYPGYYLGSIIVSQKGNQAFIVDGQQRLTSLTLVLTYLRRLQRERSDVVDVDQMIFSEAFGERSFNLDISDRNECMEALFEHGHYDPSPDSPESVHTLVDRFEEIELLFPEELRGPSLPFFIDWLKDRVQLVQITAYSDDDAYAIFETMNDRGLKLTPADMLRGYLLSNMENGTPRTKAADIWRTRLRKLEDYDDDAGADFLKTWFRSQYSHKIRERKRGARPEDWDRIGTEFHRWLRSTRESIGLDTPSDFYKFVARDFEFYGRQYERLILASTKNPEPSDPLRFVRFNSDLGFTLQYQLLLSPLRVDDENWDVDRKLELVGRFIDILIARRIWNFRATAYSTMQYTMFTIMRDIRGLDTSDLANMLYDYLTSSSETFESNNDLHVHQQNRGQLHKLLARITDYVSVGSGQGSNYHELANGTGVKYEVEHVWANQPERHIDEFEHGADFARHRNRVGDLLLLPKLFNASYGDATFETKLPHYYGQNILAASLNSLTYEKNPGFLAFVRAENLQFKPYNSFKAKDIEERGALYRCLAQRVWNPDVLLKIASTSNPT